MGVGRGVKVQEGNPLNSEMAEGGRRLVSRDGKQMAQETKTTDGVAGRRRRIVCSKDVEVPDSRAAVSGALWGLLVFVLRGPPFPLVSGTSLFGGVGSNPTAAKNFSEILSKICRGHTDLNHGPIGLQPIALPLSYIPPTLVASVLRCD